MKKQQRILWTLLLLFPLIFSVTRYAYSELRPITPPTEKEGITFMTYNIHFGRGEDDLLNLERLAQNILIGDPDIVGLQEVENGRITSQGIDMVRWLAHRLNMYFCFFPVDNELMTNPILSKYPIIAAEGYPIPSLLHKRQFTRAVIEIDETLQIDIYNVHFGIRSENKSAQVLYLLEVMQSIDSSNPTILMGDLNQHNDTESLLPVHDYFINTAIFTVEEERASIDHIFVSEYTSILDYRWIKEDEMLPEHETVASWGSDHFPVIATILF